MDINYAIKEVIRHHRQAVQKSAWEFIDVDTLYTLRDIAITVENEKFHVMGDSDKYYVMVRKSSMDNDVIMFGRVDGGNLEKTLERDIPKVGLAILAIRHIEDDHSIDDLLSARREELLDQLILCFGSERFNLADGTSFTLQELKQAISH
ncbi:hypothetical protein [Desulfitobacterium chlororespirans]|uniref:Uncharacterized protein n=1 Tax=Desulfitobacterium chlororespirans DSM 11544 TaxID=1121395 RepID=A0A1M7UZA3_9FIRM|nr:hypothetical protein [Desulfitobacterium chlororespirans]SHN88333.1 hypothetical protein SAMN02745215_05278 [Desulfitobacterium chlororespirans DSM 11544]